MIEEVLSPSVPGMDSDELAEWLESLDDLVAREGADQVERLLAVLTSRARGHGAQPTTRLQSAYVNTIPVANQPPYPGDRQLERRITHLIRWNAMAMVVRANREHHGIGGHISTFASAASLWEVAFHHFLHARTQEHPGDIRCGGISRTRFLVLLLAGCPPEAFGRVGSDTLSDSWVVHSWQLSQLAVSWHRKCTV